jgi:hypothetical protein
MECWRVFPVVVRLDDDFDVLTQRHEEAQQTFNRKLPKLAAQHFGYIRLADFE